MMTIQASVLLCKNEFIAELSDGRRIGQADLRELAGALHRAGVTAGNAQCEWRAGHRMLTAGQQVALNAELRRLDKLAEEQRTEEPVRGIALAA